MVSRMIRSQRAHYLSAFYVRTVGERIGVPRSFLSLSRSLSIVFFFLNAISHSLLGSATRGSHRNEFFLGVLPVPVNNNIST